MNNALITGHKGWIGKSLNAELERLGHEVVGVDLKDARDVATPRQLDKFGFVDTVFHLAAHPTFVSPNTIDSMYAVIEHVDRYGGHLVFASSAAVYHPMSGVYAAQKILCENLIRKYLDEQDYTILRFFNVFGHDGHGVVDRFIREYVKKEPLIINGSGEQRRDFIHVDDVVRAMVTVADNKIWGTHDIGSGVSTSLNQLLNFFPGAKIQRNYDDPGVVNSRAQPTVGLPWAPIETDLETYIKREIENYE